jgi:2'-5' RNA ligase
LPSIRDWDETSLCVVIRCPDNVASQCPYKPDDTSPPHITLAYVGSCTPEQVKAAIDSLLVAFATLDPFEVVLLGLGDFRVNFDDRRVAYATMNFSTDPQVLHQTIVDALAEAGCTAKTYTNTDRFVPHLTLAYLGDLERYKGPVPRGSWMVHALEVWHGAERYAFALDRVSPVA